MLLENVDQLALLLDDHIQLTALPLQVLIFLNKLLSLFIGFLLLRPFQLSSLFVHILHLAYIVQQRLYLLVLHVEFGFGLEHVSLQLVTLLVLSYDLSFRFL